MNLSNPSELKSVIEKHGFSFSKSLGQNFLIDKNVLGTIVDKSGVNSDVAVLEVGPGAGVLTRELAERAKKIVAVEIDKSLIPLLNYTLSDFDNAKVINEDILKVDLEKLFQEEFAGLSVIVVANLPYYITTPVIMRLLEFDKKISSITVMVQKEVAHRMAAKPGGKDYGALSVAVQFYSEPEIVIEASPSCFMPQPKVSSTVIKMNIFKEDKYIVSNREFFFKLVKSAFGQRRKTLVNALSNSPYISVEKDKIINSLKDMGLDERIRGEKLSIDEFIKLSDILNTP